MSRRGKETRGGVAVGKMPPCSLWQAQEFAQWGCGSHAGLGSLTTASNASFFGRLDWRGMRACPLALSLPLHPLGLSLQEEQKEAL